MYVTPPGPHHPNSFLLRAGLEPGIPAREAGVLTRNAKGYSLKRQSLERLFEGSEVYTQPLLAYIRYTHPPKPHSRPGHGTNVTEYFCGLRCVEYQ